MSKIYTRTGDHGETSLIDGTRLSKSHDRIDAYGTIDELNSYVGLLRETMSKFHKDELMKKSLLRVQEELFCFGSEIATPAESEYLTSLNLIDNEAIVILEQEIDSMSNSLPTLRNFILPGGSEQGAVAHICRTVCRRTERTLISLSSSEPIRQEAIQYFNRLSDWFFVLSRYINYLLGSEETIWKNKT